MNGVTGGPVFGRLPILLMGIGLGGFTDGILLHQILQWHHMLTSTDTYSADTLAGLQVNTMADGFFHLTTWIILLAGTTMAVRDWREGRTAPSWLVYTGLLLAGWGMFNILEGTVNHHILGVHHLRDDAGAPLSWDLGFLVLSTLLLVLGWRLQRAVSQ